MDISDLGLSLQIEIDRDDLTEAYEQALGKYSIRRRVISAVTAAIQRSRSTGLAKLKYAPPKVDKPWGIRWRSRRQRIAVIAHLKEIGNYPYMRSGQVTEGWDLIQTTERGELPQVELVNTAQDENAQGEYGPYAQFVYGSYGEPQYQQPFHIDTGWPNIDPIVNELRDNLIDDIAEAIGRYGG